MLRRKEDMKGWQQEALQAEGKIVGVKAPKGVSIDDALKVPNEAIAEVKATEEVKKPVKKATTKKPAKKVEKIPVEE